jgi:hypothetical protein
MYDQTMPVMQPMYSSNPGNVAYSPQAAYPALPSGLPTGPSPTPLAPAAVPAVPTTGQSPQTLQSTMFTPGFLKTQIGKRVRVEFLIGTNGPLVDRIGTLLGVGASYILIKPIDSDDMLLCDIYSIKFVTFYL